MNLSKLSFKQVIGISLLVNIFVAFFSNGYFAHDDHFLIIEASKSWVEGMDYNNWLPWNQQGEPVASGHSFFYVGLYYIYFEIVEFLGIQNPLIQIKISQILQGIFMVLIPFFGFKMIRRVYDHKVAVYATLLLSTFYFFPFFSARTLVEFFCVPFLFGAAYFIQSYQYEKKWKFLWIAGLLLGFSFNVRFQTGAFAIGFALYFILQKDFKALLTLTLGGVLGILMIQGLVDYMIWGKPFMEFAEYVRYNFQHTTSYFDEPWYKFILMVIPGFLIPPLSFFLIYGFIKSYKSFGFVVLAVLTFVAFHSYFPNKQERFIIPALPFIACFGAAYFFSVYGQFKHKWVNGLAKGSLYFFLVLNTVVGLVLAFTYSKRSRVESMVFIKNNPAKAIVLEDTDRGRIDFLPRFYADDFKLKAVEWTAPYDSLTQEVYQNTVKDQPRYIFFYGDGDLEHRVNQAALILGDMEKVAEIEPGFVDNLAFIINPAFNRNMIVTVYEIHWK